MTGVHPTDTPPPASSAGGSGFGTFAHRFDRLATTLSEAALWMGVGCLAMLLGIVLLQIFAGLAASQMPSLSMLMSASWEHAGFLMGAGFMLAMPATLRVGGHIRVSILRDHLNHAGARITDLIASLVVTGILGLLAHAMTLRALASFQRGSLSTASLTPLWLPEAAFAVAFALFALQALARSFSLIAGLEPESPRDFVGGPAE